MASSLAALLRSWRERSLLSQEQLAAKAGLAARTIRRLESDGTRRPHGTSVRMLADALELTAAERAQLAAAAREEALVGEHVPRQVPAPVRHFVGRDAELDRLTGLLDAATASGGTVVITAIGGTAGIGKTALATHWAHQVAARFADGQLYVNLRGFDPVGRVMDPAVAIRGFLDALQMPPQRIPSDPDGQAALYRSLLADRRMLVVLDNARDSGQVRPLLPGSPRCLVVVTSRNQLTGLIADGAYCLNLDLLSTVEAREFLARRLGTERVAAEPGAVAGIVGCCARLPLALAIVAAYATASPQVSLGALAAQLADARVRLDALAGDDAATDLRAVFSWSYRALSAEASRLFRLLGLHPGPDISAAAAASLAGLAPAYVGPLLAELIRANVLMAHRPGRYTFHDLLRAYATEQCRATESGDERHAATHRVLDHYVHTGRTAAARLAPSRDSIALRPPATGTTPEHIADRGQALEWFTAERAVLVAAVDHAAQVGLGTHTWQLAWTFADFLDRLGYWHDRVITGLAALAAGRDDGPALVAKAHRNLAHVYTGLGRLDDAHTHLRHALDLANQVDDRIGQIYTYHGLATVRLKQGRPAEAQEHARQSLALAEAAEHMPAQANALSVLGSSQARLGDHEQAIAFCQRALTLHQELDNRDGQADAWDSLGYAHQHLGHHQQAVTSYQHAVDLHRELKNRHYETITLARLGDIYDSTGDHRAARLAWRKALIILEDLDHPDAEQLRAKLNRRR
jgi:tetratricopeptide (TPR) repeat protein/transcriptional regulator with XRE-family HTH domain